MPTTQTTKAAESNEDKPIKGTGLGVVLALLLGLIGVLVCHFLGDESSKKAAWKTFWICLGVICVLTFFYVIFIFMLY